MNDELRRARDMAWAEGQFDGSNDRAYFDSGFEACLEHLSKGVEFDEFAARDKWLTMYEEFDRGGPVLAVLSLARWQFDQMAARVGLAEKAEIFQRVEANRISDLSLDLVNKSEARIKELESYIENVLLPADKITTQRLIEDRTYSNPFRIGALEAENTRLRNEIAEMNEKDRADSLQDKCSRLAVHIGILEARLKYAVHRVSLLEGNPLNAGSSQPIDLNVTGLKW